MAAVVKELGRGAARTFRYRVDFSALGGRRFSLRGFGFKPAAEAAAARVARLAQLRAAGEPPGPDLLTWLLIPV